MVWRLATDASASRSSPRVEYMVSVLTRVLPQCVALQSRSRDDQAAALERRK